MAEEKLRWCCHKLDFLGIKCHMFGLLSCTN